MKLNFIQRYFDAATPSVGGLDPVSASLAAVQAGLGIYQTIAGGIKAKKLRKQRTPYQTPEEIQKILQATMSQQGGYGATTLNYLTNQTNQAFNQSAGAALRLGGNPNDLSALFNQRTDAIFKTAAGNQAVAMEQFSKLMGAYSAVAAGKDAEFQFKDNLIKDQLQAATGSQAAGAGNIQSAANAFISLQASAKTADLYAQANKLGTYATPGSQTGPTAWPQQGLTDDWLLNNTVFNRKY